MTNMRTVTIKEINQLALARSIVASNVAAASNLMATLNSAVGPPGPDQRWDKIPAQNIKRDVEAVCSAIDALNDLLDASVVVAPNPMPEA